MMNKERFESIIKCQKGQEEFWFLNNVDYRFDYAYEETIAFINKINDILQSDDETLKKALKFSIASDEDLSDVANTNQIFAKHDYNLQYCESSIETLFYNAFHFIREFDRTPNGKYHSDYLLWPQYEIETNNKKYRVDFCLIDYINDKKYVIECDGYEYHSSQEQMKNDYKRQRDLENAGYSVIRFLGTEIFNDPLGCVYEVYKKANLLEDNEQNDKKSEKNV